MASTEERLSRLEGGFEHLATKADIAHLKADLIKWMVIALAVWGSVLVGAMKLLP